MSDNPSQLNSQREVRPSSSDLVETVYDPTELQLRALNEVATRKLNPTDFATPELVQLLLEKHYLSLAELKISKDELLKLRAENDNLRRERENLRIDLVKSQQRESVLWLEIPLGILSGFAINLLTSDPKNATGWVLLILCTIMLLYLRAPQFITKSKKGEENVKGEN